MIVLHPSLIISLFYASIFGIYGVILPFSPLMLKEQGLSDAEINIALSMFGLAAIVSPLVISHLADRAFPVRSILTVLLILNLLITPFWLSASSPAAAALVTFLFFATILPAMTLLEAYTVRHSMFNRRSNQRARHYQWYRIWGSVGFMLPSVAFAILSQTMVIDSATMISVILSISILTLLIARFLPGNLPARGASGTPSRQALQAAMKPPLRGIFVATAITGVALSIFYITFPRLLQELGNSPAEVGMIMNLGVVAEILLMPFTAFLAKKLTTRVVVLIGIASIPLRLRLITVWPSTGMVLATQWMHAPMVIGLFIAIPIFLGETAGESFRFSLQSLNSTITLGFSRLFGPWLAALVLANCSAGPLGNIRIILLVSAALAAASFGVLLFSSANHPGECNGHLDQHKI